MSSGNSVGNEVAARAAALIDTPWHHQGRLPGIGIDCIGLVTVIAKQRNYPIEDRTDYGRDPAGSDLEDGLNRYFVSLPASEEPIEGDIMLFEHPRTHRQHIAIRTVAGLIHARAGKDGKVKEEPYADKWLHNLKGVYRWAS